ncbi:WXG100 family type VII secretion target [Glutamicibacter sp.]|uniref:WXG100 family type VII secretion target n=1 Tax=Glutamicibacter sp. TaxID=1931995 RepID=UPI0028BDDC22|nr:WXG100 family type VII secretion target [Glutamicibacter sp.]
MTDFKASYGEMEAMSTKLDTGRDDLDGVLDQLESGVDKLLGEDFVTEHASGQFGEGYKDLQAGLKHAFDGINDMATALRDMMTQIQDTDRGMAGK